MSGATFVACDLCGRLMLGQRIGGATYPQPHDCPARPDSAPTNGES